MNLSVLTFGVAVVLLGVSVPGIAQNGESSSEGKRETYTIGLLRPGPNWTAHESKGLTHLLESHAQYLAWMEKRGVLVGRGTVSGSDSLLSVLIMKVDSLAQGKYLSERDPTVAAGHFVIEFFSWWGPAGIGREYHESLSQTQIRSPKEIEYQMGIVKRGPKWTATPAPETDAKAQSHRGYIGTLTKIGIIVAAGPITNSKRLIGLYFFSSSREESETIVKKDPFVESGRLEIELHQLVAAKGVLPDPKGTRR